MDVQYYPKFDKIFSTCMWISFPHAVETGVEMNGAMLKSLWKEWRTTVYTEFYRLTKLKTMWINGENE